MALFRKLFYKKPPDGLLEISERVYVFDSCFTTDAWEEEDYKGYVGNIIGQLKEHYPDASILVFNFREGETPSPIANVLSRYDMTIMDYPRHYEGCPLLSMEVLHHFLRSSESWLSLGLQNVLLMHCERGGWPVLAFMLAALLIYRKYYTGEHKTLDMVYKQAPRELLHFLTPLNPIPSQLRYLQYVSRRNVASEWPPLDRALTLDCVIIRMIPNFDGDGGCRPIFRIYGQDPFVVGDRTPKLLFSTPKRSKTVRHYKQGECELVKIDINCSIQGDVVLECISLHDDMEREEMMFRAMFNTAFIRSNIVMLTRDEIDILWDAKDLFPKDFRTEVLFSEMDAAAASVVPVDLSCFEEKDGLPVEAFAKVQEIFNSVDWLVPKTDGALNVLHHITVSDFVQENLESGSPRTMEISTNLHVATPRYQDKQSLTASENKTSNRSYLVVEKQYVSPKSSPNASGYKAESHSVGLRSEKFLLTSSQGPSPPTSPPLSQASVIASTESMTTSPSVLSHHLSTLGPLHSPPSGEPDKQMPQSVQPMVLHPHPHANQAPSSDTIHSHLPPPSTLPLPASATRLPSTPPSTPSPPTPPPPPAMPLKNQITDLDTSVSPPLSAAMPSKDLVTGTGQSPSLPPTSPLKDTAVVSVEPPSPPLTHPSTPPLKDQRATMIRPPQLPIPPAIQPSPPTPPIKNDKSTMIEGSLAQPPLSSLKENQLGRSGMPPPPPPPPPPTPPLKESAPLVTASSPSPPPPPPPPPPTPPLKESSPSVAKSSLSPPPPPPPPAPFPRGRSADITTASPVPPPPPPPAPSSSSKQLDSSKNISSVPSVPPPPAPPGGNSKMGAIPPPPPSLPTSKGGVSGSPSPPPPLAPPSGTKGRTLSRTMSSRNQQSKKLKPLHWLKLTRAVQGSLWAEAQKSEEASKAPEIDISELESLFSAAIPNSDQGRVGAKANSRGSLGQKSEKVQLIDHRRAYNCEIMLSKVKIPLHELMSAVLSLEDSALDADQVDNLIKFCPTKEEMELLKGYKGEKEKLGKCEQFFLVLMQVPRTESKLRVFSFKMQFQSQVSDLRKSLNIVNSAVEQIRGSAKLKRVMQTILSLGNALNQGTARGSAIGFRLDSLLKLTDTRARNNKMTLMHYLCKVLVDKLPELLDFSKDLSSLEPASKIQLVYLAEEMQAINKGLEKVVQELSMSENDGPVSTNFRKALKDFLCSAEGEVRSLASLYSGVGKNVDSVILYFGEDPTRCPYEKVVSTLLNFVRMFNQAHEENNKQLELERKKAEKEESERKKAEKEAAASEKLKITPSSKKDSQHLRHHTVRSVT